MDRKTERRGLLFFLMWRNSQDSYGLITITLHWLVTIVVVVLRPWRIDDLTRLLGPASGEVKLFLSVEGIRQ